ncbi:hypothetical protein EJ02DRAFT_514778 [Clathrospora elynae]|uniref:Uncharacterized protein n=1 Tax=Clathrospora elynae TaxID=706981 RepID=A0A6A5SDX8_9PLEO|nr:hypothetical protein EJ02DRAFT_514778 [Clathrospora elynae]
MKYRDAMILTVVLIVLFCCFFGWCLYKSCHRAIDAEFHELTYRRNAEGAAAKNSSGSGGSKNYQDLGFGCATCDAKTRIPYGGTKLHMFASSMYDHSTRSRKPELWQSMHLTGDGSMSYMKLKKPHDPGSGYLSFRMFAALLIPRTNMRIIVVCSASLKCSPMPNFCLLARLNLPFFSIVSQTFHHCNTMANANLIIALVFAGIFGAALIWLALWYIHRYIHQRCLELDHWFHLLSPRQPTPPPCVYVGKIEQREQSKQRSRSAKRERGRSENARPREQYGSRDRGSHQASNSNKEWPSNRDVENARPTIQINPPMQNPLYGQPYYPVIGWQEYPQQMMHPQMSMPWQSQGAPQISPYAMPATVPQQPLPQMAAAIPEPARYPPQYRQPYGEIYSEAPKSNQPRSSPARPKSPRKRGRRVNKVDFFHICDEYPPFIREALKKEAPSSSISSSSSSVSGTTQEVPRDSIPQATPGFADTLPFQFPQYPHQASRAYNAPTSFPRQWMGGRTGGDGADYQARYAPFTPITGHAERPWDFKAPRSRTYERRQRTTSPSDGKPQLERRRKQREQRGVNNTRIYEPKRGGKREEQTSDGQQDDSGKDQRQSQRSAVKERSPVPQDVPPYWPMPVPVVEEPLTPTSQQPNLPKKPSASGTGCPRMSPTSSVSSLDKGE